MIWFKIRTSLLTELQMPKIMDKILRRTKCRVHCMNTFTCPSCVIPLRNTSSPRRRLLFNATPPYTLASSESRWKVIISQRLGNVTLERRRPLLVRYILEGWYIRKYVQYTVSSTVHANVLLPYCWYPYKKNKTLLETRSKF